MGTPVSFHDRLAEQVTMVARFASQRVPRALRGQVDETDVAQEVLIRALLREERLRTFDEAALRRWLLMAARNYTYDLMRKASAHGRDSIRGDSALDVAAVAGRTPSSVVASRDDAQRLSDRMEDVNDPVRAAMTLHVVEGRSLDSTARLLGRQKDAVRMMLRRGYARLKDLLC